MRIVFLGFVYNYLAFFKDTLSGPREFLATLKMMKNVFYFTLKALFVLKVFKFLSWISGHVEKWLD